MSIKNKSGPSTDPCRTADFIFLNSDVRPFNTLTANYEYSRSNTETLPLPVQMQLSEKLKTFTQFFIAIFETTLNFEHFERNEPHRSSISEVIASQKRVYLNA